METWFYSGTYMPDGTPISIAAHSLFEKDECLHRGLKPIEERKKKNTTTKKAHASRTKKK